MYTSWLPTFLGVVSVIVLGGLIFLAFYLWPLTDFPKQIKLEYYNRFNTGYLGGQIVGFAFGIVESSRKLRDDYGTGAIKTPLGEEN